jgi:uncharacterized iron-regulated membrane protein
MSKKKWMKWHSWLGLKLSLLMLVICVTGTISVISHEIDWLIDSDLRVSQTPQSINWDAMAANIKRTYPQRQLFFINRPMYSNAASIALTVDPFIGARRVYLNPYSGDVIADKAWHASVQRVFRDLHRYLLSPIAGIYLVGPFGVILLASLITALVLYKKWWRGFFKLRLYNGSRAFWGSLHKVAGLWSLWFIALIAITSVWYLVEAIISDIGVDIQFDRPVVQAQQLQDRKVIETQLLPSNVVKKAKAQFSEFTVDKVAFPRDQKSPYYVAGFTNIPLVRARSNVVYIDAVSGDVLKVRKTDEQTALEIWIDLADPLHFGDFGGLITKIIWFVFGLILCAMSATGIVIYLKRIKQQHQDFTFSKKVWRGTRFIMYIVLLIPVVTGGYLLAQANDWLPRAQLVSSTSIAIAGKPVRLLLAKRDEFFYLGLSVDCQCVMHPTELFLVFKDNTSIVFKRHKDSFLGKSAKIIPEQLTALSHLEWRKNKKVLFTQSLNDIYFEF